MSIDLPTDAGESTPGQTALPFQVTRWVRHTRPTQWVLSSRWTTARASQPDKPIFFILRPARLTHPCCEWPSPDGCGGGLPTKQLNFLSYLSDSMSPNLLTDASESTPSQTTLPFQTLFLSAQQTGPTHPTTEYCGLVGGFMGPLGQITTLCPLTSRGWRPVGPVCRLCELSPLQATRVLLVRDSTTLFLHQQAGLTCSNAMSTPLSFGLSPPWPVAPNHVAHTSGRWGLPTHANHSLCACRLPRPATQATAWN